MSLVKDLPGVHLRALHAEHGLIEIDADSPVRLKIGQRVELWVRYSDATVNLHQRFYGVRNGQVESIFRIEH
jgi:D-serine deaminase-like pyridoxal phosphate-dependent protein